MNTKFFVKNYHKFFYDENAPQQEVIEYCKPPRRTKQQREKYNEEVLRMNKTHWSISIGEVSLNYLRAINHKFETWANIKFSDKGLTSDQTTEFSEIVPKPPQDIFVGNKAHDLGSILLT